MQTKVFRLNVESAAEDFASDASACVCQLTPAVASFIRCYKRGEICDFFSVLPRERLSIKSSFKMFYCTFPLEAVCMFGNSIRNFCVGKRQNTHTKDTTFLSMSLCPHSIYYVHHVLNTVHPVYVYIHHSHSFQSTSAVQSHVHSLSVISHKRFPQLTSATLQRTAVKRISFLFTQHPSLSPAIQTAFPAD